MGRCEAAALSGRGGNPNLRPYLSDNFDAAVEWYYAPNSYVAIDGFYKHLTNFIVGGVHQQSFSGLIDPFTGQEAVFNINGPGERAGCQRSRPRDRACSTCSGTAASASRRTPRWWTPIATFRPNDISGSGIRDHRPRQLGELRRLL